jgi:hypothetical protein
MIHGCDTIQTFYDAFNKITPWGATENKLGGDLFTMTDRNHKEFTELKKGEFQLKNILAMVNQWDVFQKGKKAWTAKTLAELILLLHGEEVLSGILSEDERQLYISADEEMDME